MYDREQIEQFAVRLMDAASEIGAALALDPNEIQIRIGILLSPEEMSKMEAQDAACAIHSGNPRIEGAVAERLAATERVSPSGLVDTFDRERDYLDDTESFVGVRGLREVRGVTYRDLRDCFMRGSFDASGLAVEDLPGSVYDLPWGEMDPLEVFDRTAEWLESYQGLGSPE